MKVNPLLVAAGLLYGVTGIALSFASDEIFRALGATPSPFLTWMGRLLGAALLSLGWLNWMLRHTKMGGILGRPLLITNLVFANVAFWASLSTWRHDPSSQGAIAVAIAIAPLAVGFGYRLFARPPAA